MAELFPLEVINLKVDWNVEKEKIEIITLAPVISPSSRRFGKR